MDASGIVAEQETYFFQQRSGRRAPKRRKKLPEELPHDLRFAHLNPRVAQYLANKEKEQKVGESFDDGLGSKSLLPQINQTVSLLRHRLDSILSDCDGQKLLYDEAKGNACGILDQLSRILYLFEGLKPHIPLSLENLLLSTWRDLILEAKFNFRMWQLRESRESFEKALKSEQSSKTAEERESAEGDDEARSRENEGRRSTRLRMASRTSTMPGLPEEGENLKGITDYNAAIGSKSRDSHSKMAGPSRQKTRLEKFRAASVVDGKDGRPGSRQSIMRKSTGRPDDLMSILAESMSDGTKSVVAQPSFVQTIQFQLSSKLCEDRGWIIHPDAKDDQERQTMLEWATQRLQLSIKNKKEHQATEKEMGMDQPIQVRFYGDSQKEQLQKYKGKGREKPNKALMKGQKPRIPLLVPRTEGKALLMTVVGDGSSTVYYISGRPAIVTSRSSPGKPGFYTIVYDNTPDQKILATFTPSGRGCCHHSNGTIHFLATEKGGTLADPQGAVTKRWKWPNAGIKLPVTIVCQLNNQLTFRCSNQTQMQVFFSSQKEHVKINVGMTTGAEETPSKEDMGHLISGMEFSSHAAKEFSKPNKAKQVQMQTKPKKSKKPRSPVPASEIQKLLADFPGADKSENDLEADKELARLQRKIRNLTEDWLEHYRIAVGIISPHLKTLRESPNRRQRQSHSAKSSPGAAGRVVIESAATSIPKATVSLRAPSAPPGRSTQRPISAISASPSEPAPVTVTFDNRPPEEIIVEAQTDGETQGEETEAPILAPESPIRRLRCSSSGSPGQRRRSNTSSNRIKSAPLRPTLLQDCGAPGIGLCPVALRTILLGDVDTPTCRCSRHHIPVISDIEYDEFVMKQAPQEQLIIISITSTQLAGAAPGEEMLHSLHASQNKNRSRP